jgi:hypothetical protein
MDVSAIFTPSPVLNASRNSAARTKVQAAIGSRRNIPLLIVPHGPDDDSLFVDDDDDVGRSGLAFEFGVTFDPLDPLPFFEVPIVINDCYKLSSEVKGECRSYQGNKGFAMLYRKRKSESLRSSTAFQTSLVHGVSEWAFQKPSLRSTAPPGEARSQNLTLCLFCSLAVDYER